MRTTIFLVDNGKCIFKVQVKAASPKKDRRSFIVNLRRKLPKMRPNDVGGSSKAVRYEEGVLDCIVTRAREVWFFFDKPHLLPSTESIYPDSDAKANKGNRGRERWDLIGVDIVPHDSKAEAVSIEPATEVTTPPNMALQADERRVQVDGRAALSSRAARG